MEQDASYSIVVSSFDGASDAWKPFFALLFRYWPDCPAPVFLIANRARFDDERVTTIKAEPDKGWATNMLVALQHIRTPYILYMQEDYFLQSRIDGRSIAGLARRMREWDAAYIRLVPRPRPDKPFAGDERLGIISLGEPYRASLQAALWDTAEMKRLIIAGESGWDMEREGSGRSSRSDKLFLSARIVPLIDYYPPTAIKKGKWVPGALDLCRREGIPVDTTRRPVISRIRWTLGHIKGSAALQWLKKIPLVGSLLKYVYNTVY